MWQPCQASSSQPQQFVHQPQQAVLHLRPLVQGQPVPAEHRVLRHVPPAARSDGVVGYAAQTTLTRSPLPASAIHLRPSTYAGNAVPQLTAAKVEQPAFVTLTVMGMSGEELLSPSPQAFAGSLTVEAVAGILVEQKAASNIVCKLLQGGQQLPGSTRLDELARSGVAQLSATFIRGLYLAFEFQGNPYGGHQLLVKPGKRADFNASLVEKTGGKLRSSDGSQIYDLHQNLVLEEGTANGQNLFDLLANTFKSPELEELLRSKHPEGAAFKKWLCSAADEGVYFRWRSGGGAGTDTIEAFIDDHRISYTRYWDCSL
eukprot:TRINITY_DN73023_c0_g1_i1.p1 TRINITY_DN73023_c0_g1~~TRINITY_DN73023_c0_g1_i1.p1  ORF type:complete len:316 (-),score=53.43 TRINITY_DN73023_c0_g1_i1:56-1003(-)